MDTAQLAAVAGTNRVQRSFGFIDLSGFTDFTDENGDHAAVEELQHLRAAVREVAPLFGVRIEKWLGDGAMLVGTDNEPVVAAVVAIEQRHRRTGSLGLRAGIATGEVLLLEGDDYIGRAVNLASRLCDQADAGVILASTDGLVVPAWVDIAEELEVTPRGLAEPIAVVRLQAGPEVLDPTGFAGVIAQVTDGLTRGLRGKRQRAS